jgi:hypothetical protein
MVVMICGYGDLGCVWVACLGYVWVGCLGWLCLGWLCLGCGVLGGVLLCVWL